MSPPMTREGFIEAIRAALRIAALQEQGAATDDDRDRVTAALLAHDAALRAALAEAPR